MLSAFEYDVKSIAFMFFIFTEKLLVLLRDGRKLLGILRSFDQFGIHRANP